MSRKQAQPVEQLRQQHGARLGFPPKCRDGSCDHRGGDRAPSCSVVWLTATGEVISRRPAARRVRGAP